MRAGVVVTGVLGLGTAVVFALAALTASLFPNGTVVATGSNPMMERGWVGVDPAMPVPAPFVFEDVPKVNIRGNDGIVVPEGFEPLPGDIVVTDGANGVGLEPAP
ncbi:MAG TPA: hypothetical protein VES19_12600 [Candidatus Limnocylindrales bacterium]|nr:hypothetical protein [Candidatus Limnocylindrales bacterium]